MTPENYEEMAAEGKKHHDELIYSVMIFMTVMHCSYNEIMHMPFRDYNKLLTYKAQFEQEKQAMIDAKTRQSAASIQNNRNYNYAQQTQNLK